MNRRRKNEEEEEEETKSGRKKPRERESVGGREIGASNWGGAGKG